MTTDSPYGTRSPSSDRAASTPKPHRGLLPTAVVAILVGASLLWFGVAAATAFGAHLPSSPFAQAPKESGSNGPAHVYLTITFNPVNGWDQYLPANFTVPVNTPIVFSIQSWDNGINNVSSMYQHVDGTQNGVMTFNDGMGDPEQTLTSVGPAQISHTFTVMSVGAMGGGGGMSPSGTPMLNVPIPAALNASHPITVTFTTTFTQTGSLTWMCFAPCDPNAMGAPGYMSGTITVA